MSGLFEYFEKNLWVEKKKTIPADYDETTLKYVFYCEWLEHRCIELEKKLKEIQNEKTA